MTPCPACETEVLEARDFTGAPLLLNPRPSPAGKLAVRQNSDGTLTARLITPADPVHEGEKRYQPHTCAGRGGGLAEVRKQQAWAAHAARARRGHYRPATGLSAASGVRVMPPGGER